MYLFKGRKQVIGVLILICSYAYILYRLWQIDLPKVFSEVNINSSFWILMFIQLLLVVLNVFTEALKWRVLLVSSYPVGIWLSVKMVLAGFSSGIFTPAKLGEPLGRILFLPKDIKPRAALLNYFGGFVQTLVIFTFGLIFILVYGFLVNSQFQHIFLYGLILMLIGGACLLLFWWFRAYLKKIVQYFKWKNKVHDMLLSIKELPRGIVFKIVGLSVLRYCIYAGQLMTFLYFFNLVSFNFSFVLLVPVYFLCISLVPSFLLADLGVRNSVALLLFVPVCFNEAGVMLSVSVLWMINQALPAMVGAYLVIRLSKKHSN